MSSNLVVREGQFFTLDSDCFEDLLRANTTFNILERYNAYQDAEASCSEDDECECCFGCDEPATFREWLIANEDAEAIGDGALSFDTDDLDSLLYREQ